MKTRNSWAKVINLIRICRKICRAHIQRLLPVSCKFSVFWPNSLRNFLLKWPKSALFTILGFLRVFAHSVHFVLSDRSILKLHFKIVLPAPANPIPLPPNSSFLLLFQFKSVLFAQNSATQWGFHPPPFSRARATCDLAAVAAKSQRTFPEEKCAR